MFEQIVRGALWFAVAIYGIGTIKTLTLAIGPTGSHSVGHIMIRDPEAKALIYPTIEGTDTPMPLSKPIQTSSRIVGISKLYYAVHAGSGVRDTRYRSFWR